MARLLIADDEANLRRILSSILKEDGHTVAEAPGVAAAKALLAANPYDLLITDQRMPDGDGLALLAAARDADPSLPVVFLTAHATVELAVEAMRKGAFDFIPKPFQPEAVLAVVRRACAHGELLRENERLKGEVQRLGAYGELVGSSRALDQVRHLIARVAPTGATVLITGETGTGKELVARAIHERSIRSGGPFVPANCAAFSESLLESELFGHERGAFTGAEKARQGLFEAAHRGTLFLDEAGEMSLSLQAKLLRVLVDGEVVRVGSTSARKVDVRILVATHRDLQKRVSEGLFREDLYYRLAVVPIPIPPLRERAGDIPALVDHFLRLASSDLKVPARPIALEAVEKLKGYAFPGNIRELRNLVERACILASGDTIGPEDFLLAPPDAPAPVKEGDPLGAWASALPAAVDLKGKVDDLERRLIVRALRLASGRQAEAARLMRISRSDLAYKIKKHGIVPGEE